PAFGIAGTRQLISDVTGVMIGTIVKPNVGLSEEQFRSVVREVVRASIDVIKDGELMTARASLPRRHRGSQSGGRRVMLHVPVVGLPAIARLPSFASVQIHGPRAGLAASMRSPA